MQDGKTVVEVAGIPVQMTMYPGCMDLIPTKAHWDDAARDLRSRIDAIIDPGKCVVVPTGLFLAIPNNLEEYDAEEQKRTQTIELEAQVRSRSGMALKEQVFVLNSPGTIDAGYRGEVGVILYNIGVKPFVIKRGDRIAQLVFNLIPKVKLNVISKIEFDKIPSDRGEGGFGSTGKK